VDDRPLLERSVRRTGNMKDPSTLTINQARSECIHANQDIAAVKPYMDIPCVKHTYGVLLRRQQTLSNIVRNGAKEKQNG